MRGLVRTLTSTVFIAAAAGFVFAHYGSSGSPASPPPLTGHAAVANFSVSYPSGWHRTTAPTQSDVPLQDSVALSAPATPGAELMVGTTHQSDPGSLPAAVLPAHLRAALPVAPRPQIVSLGSLAFYRYLQLAPTGRNVSESVYALPTTAGTITAVCSARRPSEPFTSSCERVLATMRVTAGKVMSLTVDAAYAFQLNRILQELNAVRTAAGTGLRSGDVKTRAETADRLAAADDQAAAAAHHITSAQVSAANQPLEAALRMNADAYRSLASAAVRQDAGGYQRAEAEIVRSQRALAAVYAQLRGFGYKIS
jgi:hypothetical protein